MAKKNVVTNKLNYEIITQMKKALFIITLICSASFLKAQKTTVWASGGVTLSSLYETYNSNKSLRIGPEVVLSLRANYPGNWGYETGIYYASKGTKFNAAGQSVHLDYAGAYFNVLYDFPLKSDDDFFVAPGIFLADAVSGKIKYTDSVTSKLDFGGAWKSFDAGVNIRVGYVINNTVTIGAHYDIGVFNIYNSTDFRGRNNKGRSSSAAVDFSVNLSKLIGKK